MKKLIFLISILIFSSCSKQESSTYKEMKSDKLLSESFTDNELENLAKIVDFFEAQICDEEKHNIEQCYNEFVKKNDIAYSQGKSQYFIDYAKSKKAI
ncbi:MAG: hypothetical protein V3V28_03405 [Polaribacter sp.]|uniref:hypothetical protein n=1 Tax=Polaribacter sp. TaxID=1920175 RepID=UPI002F3586F0